MSTTITLNDTATTAQAEARTAAPARIPLRRIVAVELRKSVDTRSGFWLLAGTGIAAVLATFLVIAFAPDDQFTYSTFTLVPHRGRVILAKGIAMLLVGVAAMLLAFPLGALGNLAGTTLHGLPPVWDQNASDLAYFALANTLLMAVGFMLGVLIRASAGAIVVYFVYAFVAPTLLTFLAMSQDWFRRAQPWVDPNYSQDALFHGGFDAQQWTQLAVTSAVWLVAPLAVGVASLLRSEVK
jgi:hypothetical protein